MKAAAEALCNEGNIGLATAGIRARGSGQTRTRIPNNYSVLNHNMNVRRSNPRRSSRMRAPSGTPDRTFQDRGASHLLSRLSYRSQPVFGPAMMPCGPGPCWYSDHPSRRRR